jgi:hypothetical protein
MNAATPLFYAQLTLGTDSPVWGVVHTVVCIEGRALSFNILLDNGANYSRAPIHALRLTETAPEGNLTEQQPWDCLADTCQVYESPVLTGLRVTMKNGKQGVCLFTIDYPATGWAALPDQHKEHHLIHGDDGLLYAMPNNYLCWHEKALGPKFTWDNPPRLRRNEQIWSAENYFRDGAK